VRKKRAGRELDGRTWDEMPVDAGREIEGFANTSGER